MNDPEYIIVDEFGIKDSNDQLTSGILYEVKTALDLPVLNYQYGYREELNKTLINYSKSPEFASKKFPLVWLVQPFSISRGEIGWYGTMQDLSIVIINASEVNVRAQQRMENNFKPILYPIYRELLNQIVLSLAFDESVVEKMSHKVIDRYYWGEAQQSVLNDVIDCIEISGLRLKISDKQNSSIFSNF